MPVSLARSHPKRPRPVRRRGERVHPDAVGARVALDEAVVDCGLYREGLREPGTVPIDRAREAAAAVPGSFSWLGLHEPSADALQGVGAQFDLHPLAVEDAVLAHQRPKLDFYDDLAFLVLKTIKDDEDGQIEVGEVMVFVGADFVLTVRHGRFGGLHRVRQDVERHPEIARLGPSAVLWAVADRIVDDYEHVIERIAAQVEDLEHDVFANDIANDPTERIYRLKQQVLKAKRAIGPLAAPIERLASGELAPLVHPELEDHFRDVHDHVLRAHEQVLGFDELLTSVLHANIAQLTIRDNRDMRRISAFVGVLAVPTMAFGLYGMNFEVMPELEWRYGYPAMLVVTALLCLLLVWRFRRAGWL